MSNATKPRPEAGAEVGAEPYAGQRLDQARAMGRPFPFHRVLVAVTAISAAEVLFFILLPPSSTLLTAVLGGLLLAAMVLGVVYFGSLSKSSFCSDTIAGSMAAVAVPLLAVLLLVIAYNVTAPMKIQGDAAWVNFAGRRRMQTYRLLNAATALLVTRDEEHEWIRSRIRDGMAEMDRSLVTLRLGDADTGIPTPRDRAILTDVGQLEHQWRTDLKPILETLTAASSREGVTELLNRLTRATNDYVAMLDAAIGRYQEFSERKIRRFVGLQFIFAAVVIVSIVVVVVVLRRIVVIPLVQMVRATKAFAGGDSNLDLPVRSRGEVGVLARSFQAMVGQRKDLEERLNQSQRLDVVGRLAGGLAHDFNNLLGIVKGNSELLLQDLDADTPWRSDVEEIIKAADRAASLTNQLLAFSRQQVVQPKALNLNAVVGDMEVMLRRLIEEDIELNMFLEPELGTVKADPGQIEQIIVNLTVNAREAMPRGGKLTMETANVELDAAYEHSHGVVVAGPYVMLTASDTGVGMDEETQSHIFEPFFTTRGQGKGTGLGLATVYGIVRQSGGYIHVYSEPGLGTTFKIYLPRIDEGAETPPASAAVSDVQRGSETILLVEDDEGLRRVASKILKRSGYTVLEACHGHEAGQICEQLTGPIDLMVTDVVMPEMNGWELAEQLVRSRPDMKVLFVSGYTDDTINDHGLAGPGVAFLQKPFEVDALARKVREVLDLPQEALAAIEN